MNTDTNKCPVCNGLGFIYDLETNSAKFCECREKAIMENRLRFAQIPERFKGLTVSSFDISMYDDEKNSIIAKTAKRLASEYISNFDTIKKAGTGLYLYSATRGSGKTHLAISIGNALMKHKNERVRFITTPELLGHIKATYNSNNELNEQQLIDEFGEIPVLILDDLGAEKVTTYVSDVFFRILNKRLINKKITILTSNIEIDNLPHDNRIKSRLYGMTCQVPMPEVDVRKKIAFSRNKELLKLLLH